MHRWKVIIRKKTGSVLISIVVLHTIQSVAEHRAIRAMFEAIGVVYSSVEHIIYSYEIK